MFICSAEGSSNDFPHAKTWWAKRITDDFYTAGRITEREVKYAIEAGFKTIVTNFNFTTRGDYGGEPLPTTGEMAAIIDLAPEAKFGGVVIPDDIWARVSNIEHFNEMMATAAKPVLLHCYVALSATFIVLGHLAMETRKDSNFRPKVSSKEFYAMAASHGLDFSADNLRIIIANLTGEPIEPNPTVPELHAKNTFGYWHAKYIHKNIYIAGQILTSQTSAISGVGFKSIVNTRKGTLTRQGSQEIPSQEETNLINVKSNTGVYADGGRQSTARLLATRIVTTRPNGWISVNSTVNYDSRNPLEYGDNIGYNENLEKASVEAAGFNYLHVPIDGAWEWADHRDSLMAASQKGLVLFHSENSTRAAILGLLAAGWENNRNSTWALERAKEIGFSFSEQNENTTVQLFRSILDKPRPSSNAKMVKTSLLVILVALSIWVA